MDRRSLDAAAPPTGAARPGSFRVPPVDRDVDRGGRADAPCRRSRRRTPARGRVLDRRRPIRRGRRASLPVPGVDRGPTVTGTMSWSAGRRAVQVCSCHPWTQDVSRAAIGPAPCTGGPRTASHRCLRKSGQLSRLHTATRPAAAHGRAESRNCRHIVQKSARRSRAKQMLRAGSKAGPARSRRRRQRRRHMAAGLSFAVRLGILLDSSGPSMGDVLAAVAQDDQFHSQPRIKIISFRLHRRWHAYDRSRQRPVMQIPRHAYSAAVTYLRLVRDRAQLNRRRGASSALQCAGNRSCDRPGTDHCR